MEVFNMQQIADSIREHEWIYKNYIPRGCVTILAAKGGVGKSGFALYIAATIARESKFKTLYVDYEQTTRHMGQRWKDWGYSDIKDYVLIPAEKNHFGECESTKPSFKTVYNIGKDNNIDLLVIDSMTSLYAQYDAESRRGGSALINELREIAVGLNCGLLLLAHTNKAVQEMSQVSIDSITGSAAIIDMSRSVMLLSINPMEEELKTVHHVKHNYTTKSPDMTFRLTEKGITDLSKAVEQKQIKLVSGSRIDEVISDMQEGIEKGLESKRELRKYVIDRGATQMEATRAYKAITEGN